MLSFAALAQQPETPTPTPVEPPATETETEIDYDDEPYDYDGRRKVIIRVPGGVSIPEIRIPDINIPEVRVDGKVIVREHRIPGKTIPKQDVEFGEDEVIILPDFDLDLDVDIDYSACEAGNENTYMGVYLESVSEGKAEFKGWDNPHGRMVKEVVANTPAAEAGLRGFDYIYGVDEYRVGNKQHLSGIIRRYNPGDQATLKVIRASQRVDVPIIFGDRNDDYREADPCDDPFLGVRNRGSHHGYNNWTDHGNGDWSRSDKAPDGVRGVRVSMIEGTSADRMGIQTNDIIQEIDGNLIYDWEDITAGVHNHKPGERIALLVNRDGRQMPVSGPIGSQREQGNCDEEEETTEEELEESFEEWTEELVERAEQLMEAEVEEVTEADMDEMENRYQIEMPRDNSLAIEGLTVFPNPGMGPFNVRFNLPQRGATLIRAFNSQGRQIYEFDLGEFQGDFSDRIDFGQNGAGAYFLVITQNGRSLTRKIVMSAR